ncbi:uncharacterized protein LOC123715224 [Pieris brassicae]|uniref:uncharacterized protein LOC123715224 n=1 Tax=Pieris brassicae TaxID=7116 RepID=UPI001E65E32C|nr:uncharacterized protein LOC123715224 [Pieris brassicae]XP_045526109.1 uncharacterized protein LOC123715224 [Pieris brassicae]XP_045526110.1 uncharacterized protein LOC123715224 [Pieris brassicae]
MEEVSKVFRSGIIRQNRALNNNLCDLLKVKPAKPLPKDDSDTPISCNFIPKTDKYYVPKKKSKLKVKTVRNIREVMEKAVYVVLNSEMERHKNILLRKIRIGSSREEATKKLAKNILRSSSPICKDVWQMLTNLNPEGHSHSAQYVLWNHKSIQINGSKGGKNKFICSFDIGKDSIKNLNESFVKSPSISHRKKILQNSLHVKFKPGPLSKKKFLDSSYQKFQYGDSTIVKLPKPGLDVKSLYGTQLSPSMINFLSENFMRNAEGQITEKWAEFSLSTLGVNKKGGAQQSEKGASVSFDLEYKCNQNRILMRNGTSYNKSETMSLEDEKPLSPEADIDIVLNKILDYVEIKLEEEKLYTKEECVLSDSGGKVDLITKDKSKRKFCELDRLDVTVIKLSTAETEKTKCARDCCSFGCICNSLECSYNLKTHCGRVDCMFVCKCINSKRWYAPSTHGSQTFSGLEDLNKKLNSRLAKEEQKFRQTVILSGEKSIMLKPRRRNWKSSKRYAEFYSNMCLKSETELKKELFVLIPKLTCDNCEPWCMVHNLYKCFCKGKFTERKSTPTEQSEISNQVTDVYQPTDVDLIERPSNDPPKTRSSLRINESKTDISSTNNIASIVNEVAKPIEIVECDSFRCARANPYSGRKYSNEYYLETNKKIIEMEKNDRRLLKKMESLMNMDIESEDPKPTETQLQLVTADEKIPNETKCVRKFSKEFFDQLPYNPKMVAWIIACYKHCKKCKTQGKIEKFLRPPRFMRIGFYTWEFILSRYRETKNFFLVTPDKPHKIFVAINQKHPKLLSYINIKDLSLDDVQNYPNEVQNLRTNAIVKEDTFWILRGLPYCWELYGVVKKKISDDMEDEDIVCSLNCDEQEPLDLGKGPLSICYGFSDDETEESNSNNICVDVEKNDSPILERYDEDIVTDVEEVQLLVNDESESKINENVDSMTKWYLMTVENDFNELHFFKKGFFVQYDHVVQAINVSQTSKKTVKLYCQKRNSNVEDLIHFGIYAIPNDNRNVVVGPYELDEPLGIEIVKKSEPEGNAKQTRGLCITINKKYINKLIDDPLSFIPSKIQSRPMIPLKNEVSNNTENNTIPSTPDNTTPTTSHEDEIKDITNPETQIKAPNVTKPIKPIKIRKSDGFYCVYPKFIHSSNNPGLAIIPKACLSNSHPIQQFGAGAPGAPGAVSICSQSQNTPKPVAEIAPQIKTSQSTTTKKFEGGMSILKPEEINKRVMEKMPGPSIELGSLYNNLDKDIENFLATASVCTLHDEEEVYIISDDETIDEVKDVWIKSKNIPSLGCIPAKINSDDHISFEFPGFKYTDFYRKEEAYRKINLVLSRKVYVPKQLKIEWEIVEDIEDTKKLEKGDLNADLVLTKQGLKKRAEIIKVVKLKKKLQSPVSKKNIKKKKTKETVPYSDHLEYTKKLVSKKEDIMLALSKADDKERQNMADRLSLILSKSESH